MRRSACLLHGASCSWPCPVQERVITEVREGVLRVPKRRMDGSIADPRYQRWAKEAGQKGSDAARASRKRQGPLIVPAKVYVPARNDPR